MAEPEKDENGNADEGGRQQQERGKTQDPVTDTTTQTKRKGGWPKGKPRGPNPNNEGGRQQGRGRQRTELTERERRFVDAYCGAAHGSTVQAARLAGYATPHVDGTKLAQRPRVRQELDKLARARGLSRDLVLGRVACIAMADMADFASLIGAKSVATVRKELARLKASGHSMAIRRLIPSRYGLGVELYPADAALGLAGKHLGLFRDQVEVNVTHSAIDGAAQRRLLDDPEACDLAASLDARLALPAPTAPEKGSGLPQDEPVDVEWTDLSTEPDKPS